ncbi:hypothetical protein AVEN_195255-1 [Araneus ventricosus]|uniref:Uncharacterized protein n=1 Tax=Araneus ventricosus TaxID=182803 RepID=A0A4Y2V8T6_ARAVE|nr:hypothetical protein AVEN_195255-1 [Araneus ventricosus]
MQMSSNLPTSASHSRYKRRINPLNSSKARHLCCLVLLLHQHFLDFASARPILFTLCPFLLASKRVCLVLQTKNRRIFILCTEFVKATLGDPGKSTVCVTYTVVCSTVLYLPQLTKSSGRLVRMARCTEGEPGLPILAR